MSDMNQDEKTLVAPEEFEGEYLSGVFLAIDDEIHPVGRVPLTNEGLSQPVEEHEQPAVKQRFDWRGFVITAGWILGAICLALGVNGFILGVISYARTADAAVVGTVYQFTTSTQVEVVTSLITARDAIPTHGFPVYRHVIRGVDPSNTTGNWNTTITSNTTAFSALSETNCTSTTSSAIGAESISTAPATLSTADTLTGVTTQEITETVVPVSSSAGLSTSTTAGISGESSELSTATVGLPSASSSSRVEPTTTTQVTSLETTSLTVTTLSDSTTEVVVTEPTSTPTILDSTSGVSVTESTSTPGMEDCTGSEGSTATITTTVGATTVTVTVDKTLSSGTVMESSVDGLSGSNSGSAASTLSLLAGSSCGGEVTVTVNNPVTVTLMYTVVETTVSVSTLISVPSYSTIRTTATVQGSTVTSNLGTPTATVTNTVTTIPLAGSSTATPTLGAPTVTVTDTVTTIPLSSSSTMAIMSVGSASSSFSSGTTITVPGSTVWIGSVIPGTTLTISSVGGVNSTSPITSLTPFTTPVVSTLVHSTSSFQVYNTSTADGVTAIMPAGPSSPAHGFNTTHSATPKPTMTHSVPQSSASKAGVGEDDMWDVTIWIPTFLSIAFFIV